MSYQNLKGIFSFVLYNDYLAHKNSGAFHSTESDELMTETTVSASHINLIL